MDTLLQALEASAPIGFTAPAEFILDLDFKERERFAVALNQIEAIARRATRETILFEIPDRAIHLRLESDPGGELCTKAEKLAASGKKVLVLVVDPLNGWQCSGWMFVGSGNQ